MSKLCPLVMRLDSPLPPAPLPLLCSRFWLEVRSVSRLSIISCVAFMLSLRTLMVAWVPLRALIPRNAAASPTLPKPLLKFCVRSWANSFLKRRKFNSCSVRGNCVSSWTHFHQPNQKQEVRPGSGPEVQNQQPGQGNPEPVKTFESKTLQPLMGLLFPQTIQQGSPVVPLPSWEGRWPGKQKPWPAAASAHAVWALCKVRSHLWTWLPQLFGYMTRLPSLIWFLTGQDLADLISTILHKQKRKSHYSHFLLYLTLIKQQISYH